MRHIKNIFLGGEDAGKAERILHQIYLALGVTALGVGVGYLALILGACAYKPLWHWLLFKSYFNHPPIVLLNLLPAIVLIWFGYFVFRRVWCAYLVSLIPCVGLALVNYFKIQLRGDPFLASDFRLIRTARGILGHYTLTLTHIVLLVAGLSVLMLLLAFFLFRNGLRGVWLRVGGALLCVAACAVIYPKVYLNGEIFRETYNFDVTNRWSDVENFVSRGFWYPFIRTIPDMFPTPPEGYDAKAAQTLLSSYEDADIPEEQKVTVVGVMLEAFCDLSDYPILARQPRVAALYEPLHALEEKSISGDLLTNIFAGGTVDSEWGCLTGYTRHDDFRGNVPSYVRYFSSQGYDTVYRHPGYGWFYNRQNVMEFLGFDESVFTENGFGALVDPEKAQIRSDDILFDYLLRDLDARNEDSAPLFSFSVSYQNHGPYDDRNRPEGALTEAETGWTLSTVSIVNNYLDGVSDTITQVTRFVDALEQRDEPILFLLYGDHKPWLGNDNSAYEELDINFDVTTEEGFRNYYSTPYLIYANDAAKAVFGHDFVGDGGDFSPCFLMTRLFDLCSWEGPGFMQLSRELRAQTPLVHTQDLYMENGVLSDTLSSGAADFYRQFLWAQYYRETKAFAAGRVT